MQNNPKTELHMHVNPQMRIGLQLFWSIVTIFIVSTMTSLRSAFEREVTFCLNLNLYSSNLATRETHGEENLKELVQEITSRALQTDSALRHTFEREVTFD